jgi:hypothetical protein
MICPSSGNKNDFVKLLVEPSLMSHRYKSYIPWYVANEIPEPEATV